MKLFGIPKPEGMPRKDYICFWCALFLYLALLFLFIASREQQRVSFNTFDPGPLLYLNYADKE